MATRKDRCITCGALRDVTKLSLDRRYDQKNQLVILKTCADNKCDLRSERMASSKFWRKYYAHS